ncbi:helix-turn-helix transcriptional regulator [Pedobacter hiemivivus]|uniref:Helix-turn-helix transcriptional regulator n=1 Tax=Pedobacter hiemivivus TaxID=2530454 RepID=A0A4U1FX30_9SPHI|nr:helix-turn-helix transcriptional regulator [Pedobacter hiemivivus]TKC55471.1 helix-turn-helix transcriptional regulator [Pedobacter hiemivivus]
MKLTLGEKFTFLRQNAKRTKKEIAECLNLALSTYVKIEDDFVYPADTLIKKTAKLYELTYDELLALGEESE